MKHLTTTLCSQPTKRNAYALVVADAIAVSNTTHASASVCARACNAQTISSPIVYAQRALCNGCRKVDALGETVQRGEDFAAVKVAECCAVDRSKHSRDVVCCGAAVT